MDLSLWDPPDFSASQHDNEDHSMYDLCWGYGRDVIEEEALNEKYCLQALNILVSRADEEITKLKEDLLMLHYQLVWYNETLIEKTDQLNILIQNLKNGNTEKGEDVHYPDLQLEQPVAVEQPQSLDGSPKPLLEFSVKIKQENPEVMTSKDNKNIEEKECCTTMPKTNKRKSELQVDSMNGGSKSPRKVQKARTYKRANDINKNVPSVKKKRKTGKVPETGIKEGEQREVEMEMEHQTQAIETLHVNPTKSMEREIGSSTQNVNAQQIYGGLVGIGISSNVKRETTEEDAEGARPCTSDAKKLTLVNLKAICKKLNIQGYTKLCKADLIKLIEHKAPHLL